MAVQILSLASGQLGTGSQGNLYQSPVSPTPFTSVVKGIRLVNTGSSTLTVNLWFKVALTSTVTRIAPKAMSLAPGACAVDDQEITMASGDQILGDCSAGTTVDFTIFGIQR
jgi:hypothetical protein